MHKLSLTLFVLLTTLGITSLKASQLQSGNDTLILKTEKHEGYGMFEGGHWALHLTEIPAEDDRRKVIPVGISDPKFGQEDIDFKVSQYQRLRKKQPEALGDFLKKYYPIKIDTANLPSVADNSIEVIVGMKGGEKIFIVDENNNQDFRDDRIRLLTNMNTEMLTSRPVKGHYRIYNGNEIVRDSGWVFIGLGRNDEVRISVAQHLKSTFSLANQEYEIQCISWIPFAGFCFDSPKISITARNGIKKDSLLFSDQLELGEYLKLGDSYYQFADVANDGSTITLIREEDVSNKIGTQPGFIAPDFIAVTTEGDSIALTDFRDQYLLLVNVTACWSRIMSYEYYKELWNHHHGKMAIVAIDESPGVLQTNIDNLGLKGKFIISKDNSSIKRSYREDYCSRVCFLIDPSGHIVEKFEIAEWEQSLAKHFR